MDILRQLYLLKYKIEDGEPIHTCGICASLAIPGAADFVGTNTQSWDYHTPNSYYYPLRDIDRGHGRLWRSIPRKARLDLVNHLINLVESGEADLSMVEDGAGYCL